MKVINSRGRVLLEVTGASHSEKYGVLYTYRGDGCGGNVTEAGLKLTIATIKLDAPSAKVIGALPTVQP
jgi:hypothetical protein